MHDLDEAPGDDLPYMDAHGRFVKPCPVCGNYIPSRRPACVSCQMLERQIQTRLWPAIKLVVRELYRRCRECVRNALR